MLYSVDPSCLTLCDHLDRRLARLLCPWNFLGRNIGAGCHFLLQGIFLTQGSNPFSCISCISRQILYHLRSPFPALKGLTWALRSSVASMSHLYSLACSLFCLDGPSSWGYLSYQACAGGPFSPKLPFPGFPLRQVTPFHSANLAGSSDIISNMSHRSPGRTESLCLAFYVFGAHKSRMTL